MTKKLNQTESRLMAEAAKREGRYSINPFSGQGSEGGRISAGTRERTALHSLVAKGLVEITGRHTSVDYNRGYAVWSTVLQFKIL